MTTKKKSRPLFEVPVEVEAGAQSGWVYRSGADEQPARRAKSSSRHAGAREPAESAIALALTLAAQVMVMGMTLATLPLTIGLRTLQSLAKPDKTR
jgi:hypothetical protein